MDQHLLTIVLFAPLAGFLVLLFIPGARKDLIRIWANVASFAVFAATWDFSTGVLAMLALLTVRIRPLFWLFVVAFNLVGFFDLILNYYHAVQIGLPAKAGEFGAAYAIPILFVPVLMITHVAAFYLLMRSRTQVGRVLTGEAVVS